MAVMTFKVEGNLAEVMGMLDQVDAKVKTTTSSVISETKKMNKEMDKSSDSMLLQAGAAIGFFWGVAQVSPVLQSYLGALQVSLGAIFDVLFASLLPMFTPLLETLLDFSSWLMEAPEYVRQVGAVLVLLIPTIWAFNAAVSANPIGAAILLIAGLTAGLYLLWSNWDMVMSATEDARAEHVALGVALMAVKVILDMVIFTWQTTYEAYKVYIGYMVWYVGLLGDIFEFVFDAIMFALDAFGEAWNGLATFFAPVVNIIKTLIEPLAPIFEVLSDAISPIVDALSALWDMITAGDLTGISDAIVDAFTGLVDSFVDFVAGAWQWGVDLIQNFVDGILSMVSVVSDAVTDVFEALGDIIFDKPENDAKAKRWGADLGMYFSQGLNGSIADIGMAIPSTYGGGSVPSSSSGSSGGGGGIGGGSTISIEINNPVLTNESNIDYLVEEVSRKIAANTQRMGG